MRRVLAPLLYVCSVGLTAGTLVRVLSRVQVSTFHHNYSIVEEVNTDRSAAALQAVTRGKDLQYLLDNLPAAPPSAYGSSGSLKVGRRL